MKSSQSRRLRETVIRNLSIIKNNNTSRQMMTEKHHDNESKTQY